MLPHAGLIPAFCLNSWCKLRSETSKVINRFGNWVNEWMMDRIQKATLDKTFKVLQSTIFHTLVMFGPKGFSICYFITITAISPYFGNCVIRNIESRKFGKAEFKFSELIYNWIELEFLLKTSLQRAFCSSHFNKSNIVSLFFLLSFTKALAFCLFSPISFQCYASIVCVVTVTLEWALSCRFS